MMLAPNIFSCFQILTGLSGETFEQIVNLYLGAKDLLSMQLLCVILDFTFQIVYCLLPPRNSSQENLISVHGRVVVARFLLAILESLQLIGLGATEICAFYLAACVMKITFELPPTKHVQIALWAKKDRQH